MRIMGNAAFNQNTFKVKLKMALSRINLNRSKVSNELTIQKKTVAEMIINGKEENARIRAEGVIRQQNMIFVFEHVSLICELLIQRISLIAKSDVCPTDLFGPIATLIYATKRIEIPELFDVSLLVFLYSTFFLIVFSVDRKSNRLQIWTGMGQRIG